MILYECNTGALKRSFNRIRGFAFRNRRSGLEVSDNQLVEFENKVNELMTLLVECQEAINDYRIKKLWRN